MSRLQAREADQAGTLDVVRSLNANLPQPLDDVILAESFVEQWPKLDEKLKAIPAPETKPDQRDVRDMVEEVVGLCRHLVTDRTKVPPEAALNAAFDALNSGTFGARDFAASAIPPSIAAGYTWHNIRSTATRIAKELGEQLYGRHLTDDELEGILLATRRIFKKRGGDTTELGLLLAVEMVKFLGSPEPIE